MIGGMGETFDVVVVGAGITGLTAAFRLKQQGLNVAVLDAAARPGGVIGSRREAGFLYETGPNSALETTPQIGELIDTLGLRPAWRYASVESGKKRFVVRDAQLHALPMSPPAFFSTPLFSVGAKLALLREPFVGRAAADVEEPIAAFVRRRLGREFLDYAIDPFVAGIYAGDPERISVPAAFPKLHALEQRWGSLIKGQILGARERRQRGEAAKNTARSFSFDGGMQVLTDALAARAGRMQLGARLQSLQRLGDGVFVLQAQGPDAAFEWRSRAVLLTVAAPAAATLLAPVVPAAAAALRSIEYAPVATVASGYRRAAIAHALDGFGALVPRREGRQALGVLFSSSMFEGRAEAGHALLTTFIGGLRNPELPSREPQAIGALAHEEHAALLGASEAPLFQQVTRWPQAIPQYTLGHLERVRQANEAEGALPGLFLGGSWKGGVSVGDCIGNGQQLAEQVRGFLQLPVPEQAPAQAPPQAEPQRA